MSNKISEHRTKIRRERILDFVKQQYRYIQIAREAYLKTISNPKSTEKEKDEAYNRYVLKLNESFMFKYGVAMADPYAKWQKKFNDAYDEVEKEFNVNTDETK